jgi:hypothetical protein
MAVVNLIVVVALPDRLGELVLGDTWRLAKTLLWAAGLQMVFIGMTSGVRSTLLGVRAISTTLRVDIAQTLVTFGATILGAIVWGNVLAAFWTVAVGQGAMAVIWWAVYRHHVSHHEAEAGAIPTTSAQ